MNKKILYLHSFGLLDVRIKDIIYDFLPKNCQKLLSLFTSYSSIQMWYMPIYLSIYLLTVYNEFHTDPCTVPHKWSKQIMMLT